jgi:hypothetical protein
MKPDRPWSGAILYFFVWGFCASFVTVAALMTVTSWLMFIGLIPTRSEFAAAICLFGAVISGCVYGFISARNEFRERIEDRNAAEHLCRKCGYDLRATPYVCPECGTIAKKRT